MKISLDFDNVIYDVKNKCVIEEGLRFYNELTKLVGEDNILIMIAPNINEIIKTMTLIKSLEINGLIITTSDVQREVVGTYYITANIHEYNQFFKDWSSGFAYYVEKRTQEEFNDILTELNHILNNENESEIKKTVDEPKVEHNLNENKIGSKGISKKIKARIFNYDIIYDPGVKFEFDNDKISDIHKMQTHASSSGYFKCDKNAVTLNREDIFKVEDKNVIRYYYTKFNNCFERYTTKTFKSAKLGNITIYYNLDEDSKDKIFIESYDEVHKEYQFNVDVINEESEMSRYSIKLDGIASLSVNDMINMRIHHGVLSTINMEDEYITYEHLIDLHKVLNHKITVKKYVYGEWFDVIILPFANKEKSKPIENNIEKESCNDLRSLIIEEDISVNELISDNHLIDNGIKVENNKEEVEINSSNGTLHISSSINWINIFNADKTKIYVDINKDKELIEFFIEVLHTYETIEVLLENYNIIQYIKSFYEYLLIESDGISKYYVIGKK